MNDFGNVIIRPLDVTDSQPSPPANTGVRVTFDSDNRQSFPLRPIHSKRPEEDVGAPEDLNHSQDVIKPLNSQYRSPSNKLRRKLKERHINMIAFSSVVGVGFFLQNGRAIYLAGPGMTFLIYPVVITIVWAVMGGLGEMTALYPIPGALFELPARFLDQSAGYAVGWMAWFSWVVIVAAELDAIASLFRFNFPSDYLQKYYIPGDSLTWPTAYVNPAVWVAVFWLFALCINMLPIRVYGEVEYWFGVVKMFFFVGLILFQLGINLETNTGDQYYRHSYSFITQSFTTSTGAMFHGGKAQLAGVWTAIVVTIYSLVGFESVTITAAENEEFDPDERKFASKESIMISTRKIGVRILMLYSLSSLLVSFNVPQGDTQMANNAIQALDGGQSSSFVIAAVRAKKTFWPGFINGFYILSATSASINSVYLSSRLLHALALAEPAWPDYKWARSARRWLERVNSSGLRKGVPQNAIIVSGMFGLLGFLACSESSDQGLGRLAINSSVSTLIVYIAVCFTYLRFKKTLRRAVGGSFPEKAAFDRECDLNAFNRNSKSTYPYRSTAQPFRAFMAAISCILIALFNGWRSVSPFKAADFFASYISVIVFFAMWAAYRIRFLGKRAFLPVLSPSIDMRAPTIVHREGHYARRDQLDLDTKNLYSSRNFRKFVKWIWVWLK